MGMLFIGLGILSLLWFVYEVIGIVATGGTAPGDNPFLSLSMTGLKLFLTIWFFYFAFFKYLKTKD